MPVMILTVVDLPAPFGPRKPTISPGATLKLTFSTAGIPRKLLERFCNSSMTPVSALSLGRCEIELGLFMIVCFRMLCRPGVDESPFTRILAVSTKVQFPNPHHFGAICRVAPSAIRQPLSKLCSHATAQCKQLFIAKRHHRLNLHCCARRNQGCRQRH